MEDPEMRRKWQYFGLIGGFTNYYIFSQYGVDYFKKMSEFKRQVTENEMGQEAIRELSEIALRDANTDAL